MGAVHVPLYPYTPYTPYPYPYLSVPLPGLIPIGGHSSLSSSDPIPFDSAIVLMVRALEEKVLKIYFIEFQLHISNLSIIIDYKVN